MFNLKSVLEETSSSLAETIDDILPEIDSSYQSKLYEAMRYSTISGGKRLRPFLTVTTAQLFGVSKSSALNLAAAIEFIHTYSLIHDDLPAMDNDDYRRGKPTCHKKFGQATAILAGDALLTLAFEILSDSDTHASASVRCELIKIISKASGHKGMVGGQMFDINSANNKLSVNEIIKLQRLKTGELFAVSCESGAVLGNASESLRKSIKAFAYDLGLIFQITDDLIDGKANDNSDSANIEEDKPTLVNLLGREKSREQVKILANQAIDHLKPFGKKADILKEVTDYIVHRKS